ncbi:MAG: hypothetical protein AB2L07_02615 [Thermoanaerobaculaceae bacterium]
MDSRHMFLRWLAPVALIAVLGIAPSMAQNLVMNGTFSSDVSNWEGDSTVQAVFRGSTGSTLPGGSGPGCLEAKHYFWNGGSGGPRQLVNGITPGREYEIAASYFMPSGTDNVADGTSIYIYWLSEHGTMISSDYVGAWPLVKDQWVRLSGTKVAPAGAVSGRFFLGVANPILENETRPGVVYFDDVWLAEKGATTATQQLFLPVASSKAGAHNTYWTTDLWVQNLVAFPVTLAASTLPANQDNTSAVASPTTVATIQPNSFQRFADVLGTLNTHVTGGLYLRATAEAAGLPAELVMVVSRNSTPNPGANGSYGQGLAAVEPGTRARTVACGVFESSDNRTNVGVLNTSSSSVTVAVTIRNAQGGVAGQGTWNLLPYEHRMVNVGALGATAVDGGVAVFERTSQAGSFRAFASVVDNHTGDSVYVEAR